MKFVRLVSFTLHRLKEAGFNSRSKTTVQKVIYFSLSEEERKKYYVPFLCGPYSEDVQLALLECTSSLLDVQTDLKEEERHVVSRIEKNVKLLKQRNVIRPCDLALLSQVHFLLVQKGFSDDASLKKAGRLFGWHRLAELPASRLNYLKEVSEELQHAR
ncbi:MAG: hypothetical protein GXO39_04275 [Thermotogae bacterium]|nr:hypothetical protein [Thermotogota bacterium]